MNALTRLIMAGNAHACAVKVEALEDLTRAVAARHEETLHGAEPVALVEVEALLHIHLTEARAALAAARDVARETA